MTCRTFQILLLLAVMATECQPVLAASREDYFKEGDQAYEQGDYERAAKLYEKVVEIDPNDAKAYNALGLTYRNLNASLEDVIWLFKVATDIDPQYMDAYDNQCKTYYQVQQYPQAEEACKKMLAIAPGHGGAQFTLGWIALGKSQPNQAVGYFEEVLKKVQIPAVYLGLGTAYAQSGNHAQVLEVVTKLREVGQLQMATQLENMIRSREPIMPFPEPSIEIPEKQPGTLVPSTARAPAAAPTDVASPQQSKGGMQIRLRGRLSSTPQAPAAGQSAAAPAPAPAPAPDTYGTNSNRSAIDRIRDLQRKRLGYPSGGGSSSSY